MISTGICRVCKEDKELYPTEHICRKCRSEKTRQWQLNNPERTALMLRKRHYSREYGITLDEYNETFENQQGKCAICGTHQIKLKKTLGQDHDHEFGYTRGLLCDECNKGLGCFKDNVELLQVAIQYLKEWAI